MIVDGFNDGKEDSMICEHRRWDDKQFINVTSFTQGSFLHVDGIL